MVKTDRKNGKWLFICQICDQFFKIFPCTLSQWCCKVSARVHDHYCDKNYELLLSGSSDYTVYIDMTENVGGRRMVRSRKDGHD